MIFCPVNTWPQLSSKLMIFVSQFDETDPNLKWKSEIQQTLKKAMHSYKELLTKRETEAKCAKDPDPDGVLGLYMNDSE